MAQAARDTIYALSSAPGRAAIAVVRVSGPRAGDALRALTGEALPPPRLATVRQLKDSSGESIDQALVLGLRGAGSAAGEDIAGFQLQGGRAVVDAVLHALAARPGVRAAEPGEAARRGVEGGEQDGERLGAGEIQLAVQTPA